jgi:hypothetical protein
VTPIPQLLTNVGQDAAPKNKAQLEAMSERRDELNDQLETLNERRSELASQIGRIGSDPVVRAEPVARLRALDERIRQMEADIERSDKLIAEARGKGVGSEEHAPGGSEGIHIPPIPDLPGMIYTPGLLDTPGRINWGPALATTVPITMATVVLLGALMYWRISRSVRNQLAKIMATQSGRLDEIQRSVDTVAVEMERVSENQRFVTKLVGEKAPSERR